MVGTICWMGLVKGWVIAHPSQLGWTTSKFGIGGEQELVIVAGV